MPYSIMISAGEASGDIHSAEILHALDPLPFDYTAFGMGGPKLAEAGMEINVDCREISVVGLVEPLLNYRRIKAKLLELQALITARQPDLLIVTDFPDFNLRLARFAKSQGVKVLYYVSPQVWAWRQGRVNKMKPLIDHMAVIFPFEQGFYEQAGIPVTYVGHPLVDEVVVNKTREHFCSEHHLDPARPIVALMPGSRRGEIKRLMPLFIQVAKIAHPRQPLIQWILPRANTIDRAEFTQHLDHFETPVEIIENDTHNAISAADAVLTASGTATLEIALIGTPFTIAYKINPLSYAILSRMVKVDQIGLVNIVAGKPVIKEFIQHQARAGAIAVELDQLLNDSRYRRKVSGELHQIRDLLGEGGAADNMAELVQTLLEDADPKSRSSDQVSPDSEKQSS